MTTKPNILIIDDERNTREGLRRAFRHKYEIHLAENADRGFQTLAERPVDVVLTDLRMPGMDGMEFTRKVTARDDAPLVIMLTAYGTLQTAVDAMKIGAYDYLTKPINLDNLEMVIDRGLETRRLRAENEQLREELDERFGLENIVGNSSAMAEVFEMTRQVAAARSTVMITGESGTGKELIAHAIHQMSSRSQEPFVVVHCDALNENLLETELFGHEKGAYTSAHERVIGRFEKADGGTLFLDEIGEVNASIQVKLLRVLETRRFERVGGTDPIEVDVRLIAATNRDLKKLVEQQAFREDLYYRLNVVNIHLPPLRKRPEDIPLLLDHFLAIAVEENAKKLEGFSSEAVKVLNAYSWPGNVRELRNCVERMAVMARGARLTLNDVPADISQAVSRELHAESGPPEEQTGEQAMPQTLDMDTQERNLIIRALKQTAGNRTEAANTLGISRRTLHRKLKTYGLQDFRG